MYCEKCGEKIGDEDTVCPKCGQRQSRKEDHRGRAAFICVVVALLVVFYILRVESQNNNQTSDPVGTAPQESGRQTELPVASSEPKPEPETEQPTATPFAAHDVTDEMKENLKPIMNQTTYFFGLLMEVDKINWDDQMCTIMTYYNLEYRDSKIKYNETEKKARPQVEKEMQHLFGSSVKYALKTTQDYPGYLYSVEDGCIVYNGGDLGDAKPIGKTLYVAETEPDVYRVVRHMGLKDRITGEKIYSKKITCTVKKDETSKYGYIITGVRMYQKGDCNWRKR